jgi:hypothetical protein
VKPLPGPGEDTKLKSLTRTKEDEKVLDLLLLDLEIFEPGYEAAQKRYLERYILLKITRPVIGYTR